MTGADVVRTPVDVPVDGLDIDHVAAVWHHPADPVEGLSVLLTHGAGGNVDDPALVALADVVAAAGHPAVRVTMPYRQRRAKGPPPRAERGVGDLAAVIAGILDTGTEPGPWVLGGKSYGGRLATMVAARVPGVDRVVEVTGRLDVVGVACLSYPLHPPGRPDRVRVDHFDAIDVPVLFVQGTHDPFGGPDELCPHLGRLSAPATVVPVGGGDHSLRVPRTRSADGRTHPAQDVVAGLTVQAGAWFAELRAA